MNYFSSTLNEELILLEIYQLATHPDIFWILLEAESPIGQAERLKGQMSSGELDFETAANKLGGLLDSTDFGEWDVMNAHGQMKDLLQAYKGGKIDDATYERRLKQIKKEAFLYNTIFTIGKALFGKLGSKGKHWLGQAFEKQGINQREADASRKIANWQPTGGSMQRAQDIARQLVDLVGHRQALALLKQAA